MATMVEAPSPEKQSTPARNLTQAFEALCVDDDNDVTTEKVALVSPTGVADDLRACGPHSSKTGSTSSNPPYLELHPDLKRDLSQALVNRVSFYGIIHDINKEASAMATNDPLQSSSNASQAQPAENESTSPLIVAVLGTSTSKAAAALHSFHAETAMTALIDEEVWLLSTIATREDGARRACPDTFLQAMGEKEYENPVASLAGNTRTQLWKPSRSWWEAKSGKNPWIEPTSHNKRWRYLWPLIHYHKFLAKCIKKLKRNGVDVKQSVSPVAVFLREEVCAVSDHLAGLSLFDSDQWMAALKNFKGWTNPAKESVYRSLVAELKLRPLDEQVDVDSPLLRSQIDEHFLRTMAAARAQLRESAVPERKKKTEGQPPVYPRGSPVPKHIHPQPPTDKRAQSWQYAQQQQPGWWNNGQWEQRQQQAYPGYCDNSSVHSGLSADSYPQPSPLYPAHMHAGHPHAYHPYPTSSENSHASGYNYNGAMYDPHVMGQAPPMNGWMDPATAYAMQMQQSAAYYPAAIVPTEESLPRHQEEEAAAEIEPFASETPQKRPNDTTQSPFWSHLDQATLSMALATPAKASPLTPRRRGDNKSDDTQHQPNFAVNAQPLLLRHNQYYGYSGPQYSGEGYGPPSPATQFMMSPQSNFGYSYNYGHSSGFSPGRHSFRSSPKAARNKSSPHSNKSPLTRAATKDAASLTPVRKLSPTNSAERESPSTVETTAETESLHDAV